VTALGNGKVAANCVWLALLVLAVTAGYHVLDRTRHAVTAPP
jgi:hypothetical protein